jgi:hypothetical protein
LRFMIHMLSLTVECHSGPDCRLSGGGDTCTASCIVACGKYLVSYRSAHAAGCRDARELLEHRGSLVRRHERFRRPVRRQRCSVTTSRCPEREAALAGSFASQRQRWGVRRPRECELWRGLRPDFRFGYLTC